MLVFPIFSQDFPMDCRGNSPAVSVPFRLNRNGTRRGLHASIIGRALGRSFANVCGGPPQGPQGEGEIQGDRRVPSCSIYVYYIVYIYIYTNHTLSIIYNISIIYSYTNNILSILYICTNKKLSIIYRYIYIHYNLV